MYADMQHVKHLELGDITYKDALIMCAPAHTHHHQLDSNHAVTKYTVMDACMAVSIFRIQGLEHFS